MTGGLWGGGHGALPGGRIPDLDEVSQLWFVTAIWSLWVEICLLVSLQLKGYKGEKLFLFFSFLSFVSLLL